MREARLSRRALLGAGAALLAAPALAGEPHPSRAIRLVIGWPPGGGVDAFGRILAPVLAERLGRPIAIENIGGASGRLGSQAVVRAAADGHTLLLANDTFAATEALQAPGTEPLRPLLLPLTQAVEAPNALVVPAAGFADVAAFVAAARARPGRLNIGIPGIGSSQHMASEIVLQAAGGLRAEHIAYRGGGPLLIDLVAGKLDAGVLTFGAAVPQIREGRLRAIGLTTATRSTGFPDVPTFAETLVPGLHIASWQGLFAPVGTPRAVADRVHAATAEALTDPALLARLEALGFAPASAPGTAFAAAVDASIARYAAVVRDAGIRSDGA